MDTKAYEFFLYSYFGAGENVLEKVIDRAYRDMASHTLTGFPDNESGKNHKNICKRDSIDVIRTYITGEEKGKSLSNCVSLEEFVKWHKNLSKDICLIYTKVQKECPEVNYSYGQAQKWINMSLKYLYLLYILDDAGIINRVFSSHEYNDIGVKVLNYKLDSAVKETIKKTYKYYHVPLDNYILKRVFDIKKNCQISEILKNFNIKIKKDGTTYKLICASEAYSWSSIPFDDDKKEGCEAYDNLQSALRQIAIGEEYDCALDWEFSNWIIGAVN